MVNKIVSTKKNYNKLMMNDIDSNQKGSDTSKNYNMYKLKGNVLKKQNYCTQ